jgi:hypothetical protein
MLRSRAQCEQRNESVAVLTTWQAAEARSQGLRPEEPVGDAAALLCQQRLPSRGTAGRVAFRTRQLLRRARRAELYVPPTGLTLPTALHNGVLDRFAHRVQLVCFAR